MRKIFANREQRKLLKQKFGASNTAVSDALNFRFHSVKKRMIRSYAVNFLHCAYRIDVPPSLIGKHYVL